MSDQQDGLFSDPRFIALRTPFVRYVLPYDAFLVGGWRQAEASGWLDAAHAAGADVLVSFTASDRHPRALPSPRRFVRAVAALRAKFRWLRTFSTWNEPNHRDQPFYRHPEAQARLYLSLRRHCAGCTVLASEPLDSGNLRSWIRRFLRVVKGPQLWGFHNYLEVNPRPGAFSYGTKRFLRLVRGPVWITETGGIVYFSKHGQTKRGHSLVRAAHGLRAVFRVADALPRVRRVYIYQWRVTPGSTWDSAFIAQSGKARKSLLTLLVQELRRHPRGHRRLKRVAHVAPAPAPGGGSQPPPSSGGGSSPPPPPPSGGGSSSPPPPPPKNPLCVIGLPGC